MYIPKNENFRMESCKEVLNEIKRRNKKVSGVLSPQSTYFFNYMSQATIKKNFGEALLPSTANKLLSFDFKFTILDDDFDEYDDESVPKTYITTGFWKLRNGIMFKIKLHYDFTRSFSPYTGFEIGFQVNNYDAEWYYDSVFYYEYIDKICDKKISKYNKKILKSICKDIKFTLSNDILQTFLVY